MNRLIPQDSLPEADVASDLETGQAFRTTAGFAAVVEAVVAWVAVFGGGAAVVC
jgi:hypothetical protein